MQPLENKELSLIRDYITLPIVLLKFEEIKKVIESSTVKTKSPFIDQCEHKIDTIIKEMSEVKRQMMAIKLKAQLIEKSESGLTYLIVYKGYEHRNTYLWERLRVVVEVKMRYYLGEDIARYEDYGI